MLGDIAWLVPVIWEALFPSKRRLMGEKMNRRNFLAALTVSPFVTKLEQLSATIRTADSGTPINRLRVILEGPFAVVLQKDYGNRIRAFVPHGDNHVFFLNGTQRAGNGFHLRLLDDGLEPYSSCQVDDGFAAFHEPTAQWLLQDYYVSIDLPCPQTITYDQSLPAVLATDPSHKVKMPVNHILEYDFTDSTKLSLSCTEIGPTSPRQCTSLPCLELSLQVGLLKMPHSPDPDPHAHKAKAFFNKHMLDCFPELKKKKRIKKIITSDPKGTDVECKNGGLIISFPS